MRKQNGPCRSSNVPFWSCSSVRPCVPAGGSVPRDYLTYAPVQAVVRLQSAGALTRQPVHGAVTRLTQTLCLLGPAVHNAARKLVAGQEPTGVRVVTWRQPREEGEQRSAHHLSLTDAGQKGLFFFVNRVSAAAAFHLVPLPKSDCRSLCRDVWKLRCRNLPARSELLLWRYKVPACPVSFCCSPQRCRSWSWGSPAAWIQSNWIGGMAEAVGKMEESKVINISVLLRRSPGQLSACWPVVLLPHWQYRGCRSTADFELFRSHLTVWTLWIGHN